MDLKFLMAGGFVAMVAKYGYIATLVGTLLEGETFLILSGLAAFRGYLDISVLYAVGATGAIITDSFFFALGRVFGPAILNRFPRLAPSVARAHDLIDRLPNTSVIGLRFIYGMRTVGPVVVGAGRIATSRFLLLDVVAALLWSFCWISAGFLLGEAVTELLEAFAQIGRWLLLAALGAIAIVAVILLRRRGAAKSTKTHGSTN